MSDIEYMWFWGGQIPPDQRSVEGKASVDKREDPEEWECTVSNYMTRPTYEGSVCYYRIIES